jgi:hypothetical protein
MASQTFSLSGAGLTASSTVTLGAGECVVVRFTKNPQGRVSVVAALNSTTTRHPVNTDGFASDAFVAGTVLSVELDGQGSSFAACAGIIETGA